MKTFFLEITMILGEKKRKGRSNQSEDLFFRDCYDFGRKEGNARSKPFFFREQQVLEIFASGP